MDSDDNNLNLTQSRISKYFSGVKSVPTEPIKTSKKKGYRPFCEIPNSQRSSNSVTTYHIEKRELAVPILSSDEEADLLRNGFNLSMTVEKRKLVVPISSDDELGDANNNGTTPQCDSTPVKKHIPMISTPSGSGNITLEKICIQISESPVKRLRETTIVLTEEKINKKSKKINYQNQLKMRELCLAVITSPNLKSLLTNEELDLVMHFFNVEKDLQYICMKLYLWKHIWYIFQDYCAKIGLEIENNQVSYYHNILITEGLVDAECVSDDLCSLLNNLNMKNLREIFASFRLKNKTTKEAIIDALLKHSNTQMTLTGESTEQILRKRIKKVMGLSIKISPKLVHCLNKIVILNTFANPDIRSPKEFFGGLYLNIDYPSYKIDDYPVFAKREDFETFYTALQLRNAFEDAIESKSGNLLEICQTAFTALKQLQSEEGTCFNNQKLKHLEQFTAISQYVSILTHACKYLVKAYWKEMEVWLLYLLQQEYSKHRLGFWYRQLCLIKTMYKKDYTSAAKLLIEALQNHGNSFSEVDLHELAHKGRILNRKVYKLEQELSLEINILSPSEVEELPEIYVDSTSVAGNQPGQKRTYMKQSSAGDKEFMSVEEVSRQHYLSLGFTNGLHCEGGIVTTSFCLLFWDIIYDYPVSAAFLSPLQSTPLDMYSPHFATNRHSALHQRLQDIENGWTESALFDFLVDKWLTHSHQQSLCKIDAFIQEPEVLFTIIMCIGRQVISKIFQRFLKNPAAYRSGLPDLLMWNHENSNAKFVEVKSENDKLSINQKLWLGYLMSVGADVEVCHVRSPFSKRRRVKNTAQ